MSILGEEPIIFDDEDLEDERRFKTDFLIERLPLLDTHSEWWIPSVHDDLVAEYVACRISVRELDKQIMNDAVAYGSLDRVRNNTIQRAAKLLTDLGLTAAKMKSLMPKTKPRATGLSALANEEYVE